MLIFLILGIVLIGIGLHELQATYYLKQNGIIATGKVIDVEMSEDIDSKNEYPTIEFEDFLGQKHTKKISLSFSWKSFSKGQRIKVIYLKDAPEDFLINDNFYLFSIEIFGGFFGFGLITLYFLEYFEIILF